MGLYTIENGYRRQRHWKLVCAGLVIVFAGGYGINDYVHIQSQVPKEESISIKPVESLPLKPQKMISSLPWPKYGQAAYGVVNDGVLAESDDKDKPVPIASLAKIITALAVLQEKPLAAGAQGPVIVLTDQDEALYRKYLAKNGTVVPVQAGEQITQYQALEAMLMSSSNNMADTLAIWAFGSVENYNTYANNMLREFELQETTVADATGFSPSTKSTAAEMVKLGILYIKDPVLKNIASQKKATIPFVGTISNYNSTINQGGILGLKIGNTDEAGRTFLVADVRDGDINETSVVAVIGADSLPTAMKDAEKLLKLGNVSHDLLAGKP